MAFGISLVRVKSLKGLLGRWQRVGGTVRAETLVEYWNAEKDEVFVPMRFGDVRIGDFRCSCCAEGRARFGYSRRRPQEWWICVSEENSPKTQDQAECLLQVE